MLLLRKPEPTAAAKPAPQNPRGRPMWCVRGLITVLDRNEDKILELIESGDLAWAFDLSLVPERARSRELRILPACVDCFLQRRECKLEWPEVLKLVTPHNGPILRSIDIQRSLNVSSAHVSALIRRKCLTGVSSARPGPNGSARVRADSFAKFLRERRFF